ncbi:hypothetical protein F8M41_008415 [Gigaspora margarita]|uniref:Uncharacterized protein n=1 Tax=Gigaspora margarita TaxID=4874 RepID=A0A8H3X497_GIGMA|nr:hypothetical protein F8M41_008415 [Gigaspora margarita]
MGKEANKEIKVERVVTTVVCEEGAHDETSNNNGFSVTDYRIQKLCGALVRNEFITLGGPMNSKEAYT